MGIVDWLFPARCPVTPERRAWVDERWAWLERSFGATAMHEARVVLPEPEFFPDRWDATPEAAARMFERVKGYMGLAAREVSLDFYEQRDALTAHNPLHGGGTTRGAAGLFVQEYGSERPRVLIDAAGLVDATALVSTMAHELAHVRLIAEGRIDPDATDDHEPLTDLVTVFLGLGVFTANSVVRERNWEDGTLVGWSVGRLGYLAQEEVAWALARFAAAREESRPAWAGWLCHDVSTFFRASVRVLARERAEGR